MPRHLSEIRPSGKVRRTYEGVPIRGLSRYQAKRYMRVLGRWCRYCKTKQGPFAIDHIWPLNAGGRTVFENLTVACKKCNSKKRASTSRHWFVKLARSGDKRVVAIAKARLEQIDAK